MAKKGGVLNPWGALLLAVMLGLVTYCVLAPTPPNVLADRSDQYAAYYCHDFAKERLKNPTDAVFADVLDYQVVLLEKDDTIHHYQVFSWVESTNSFGAKLRKELVCDLSYITVNDSWVLHSLDIGS